MQFWKATIIRAVRTICQTAVATIGTAMVITEVDWKYVVSASLLSGLLSVLTSVATGLPEVELDAQIMAISEDGIEPFEYDEEIDDGLFDNGEA